jgi:hypothetical protein
MTNKDYLKDISDIKNMMNKSSRFNSLSGISGIATGLYAIIGSLIAYQYVVKNNIEVNNLDNNTFYLLLADLILIILLSLITSFIITRRKTKEETRNGWSILTKKMVYNFSIILIPSAIYILVLIMKNDFVNAGSLMLFFYGASLINASHHTFKEIKTLGLVEIILGILVISFPEFTFWIWFIGAGIVHIIFGLYMYLKHEQK